METSNEKNTIEELWEKQKRLKPRLDARREEIESKIKSEETELEISSNNEQKKLYDDLPQKYKNKIDEIKKLRKKTFFWKYFFSIALVVIILHVFWIKFRTEYMPYYFLGIIGAVVISLILSKISKNITKKKIKRINSIEVIVTYNKSIKQIKETYEASKKEIRTIKYCNELEKIEKEYEDYYNIQTSMIEQEYEDCVLFYFNKFALGSYYEIYVDGILCASSGKVKEQLVRINPGYHSLKIRLVTDYGKLDDKIYAQNQTLQISKEDCPKFVYCPKVDGVVGECSLLSAEEFMEKANTKLV